MDINYILSKSNIIKRVIKKKKEYNKQKSNINTNETAFCSILSVYILITFLFSYLFKENLNNLYYFYSIVFLINFIYQYIKRFNLIKEFEKSNNKKEKELMCFINKQESEINKKGEDLSYYNIIYNIFKNLDSKDIKKIKPEKINGFLSDFNIEEKFILSNILSLKIRNEQEITENIKENLSIIK